MQSIGFCKIRTISVHPITLKTQRRRFRSKGLNLTILVSFGMLICDAVERRKDCSGNISPSMVKQLGEKKQELLKAVLRGASIC